MACTTITLFKKFGNATELTSSNDFRKNIIGYFLVREQVTADASYCEEWQGVRRYDTHGIHRSGDTAGANGKL